MVHSPAVAFLLNGKGVCHPSARMGIASTMWRSGSRCLSPSREPMMANDQKHVFLNDSDPLRINAIASNVHRRVLLNGKGVCHPSEPTATC